MTKRDEFLDDLIGVLDQRKAFKDGQKLKLTETIIEFREFLAELNEKHMEEQNGFKNDINNIKNDL